MNACFVITHSASMQPPMCSSVRARVASPLSDAH